MKKILIIILFIIIIIYIFNKTIENFIETPTYINNYKKYFDKGYDESCIYDLINSKKNLNIILDTKLLKKLDLINIHDNLIKMSQFYKSYNKAVKNIKLNNKKIDFETEKLLKIKILDILNNEKINKNIKTKIDDEIKNLK